MFNANALALIGRLFLSLLFLLSGLGKLGSAASTQAYISAAGLPFPVLVYLITLIVEIGGGALLCAGFRTSLAALVLAGFTLLAALIFHHDFSDHNQMVQFLKNIAISGGLLQIAAFGARGWSLDARR
jgi:putative oxidoreductase